MNCWTTIRGRAPLLGVKRQESELNWLAGRLGSIVMDTCSCLSIIKSTRLIGVAWFYVYGRWPRDEIDHINRIRSDNRIVNLREATHHQNTCNGPPRRTSKSGLIGVSWDSGTGQWRAHITVAGRTRHLGRFDSITEATVARQAAARAQFGDFAPQART